MVRINEDQVLFLFVIAIAAIMIAIFYLKNLQDVLKECSPRNQQVPPGNVWLMLIPLFNIVYPFILYPKISESLKREFEERGSVQEGDYLKNIGLTMAVLNICGFIPVLGNIAGLAGLILLIIYWVKTAEYKNKLRMLPKAGTGVRISDNPDILD